MCKVCGNFHPNLTTKNLPRARRPNEAINRAFRRLNLPRHRRRRRSPPRLPSLRLLPLGQLLQAPRCRRDADVRLDRAARRLSNYVCQKRHVEKGVARRQKRENPRDEKMKRLQTDASARKQPQTLRGQTHPFVVFKKAGRLDSTMRNAKKAAVIG